MIRRFLQGALEAVLGLLMLGYATTPLVAQTLAEQDTAAAATGAQLVRPLTSLVVPGLGQYLDGAPLAGLGFTSAAAVGVGVYLAGDGNAGSLPRSGSDQLANQGWHVLVTAGALSAYDAFRRSIPALRQEGKYDFLPADENVGDLMAAPFDVDFLARWTTWVDLAFTAAVVGVVLGGREEGVRYEPYVARDAAFTVSLSFNAAVGEEALFRGWLLPLLYQNLGGSFWASNTLQAATFAGLHVPQAEEFALALGAWALYEGWLVQRNDWSIRESVFHHFWYDAAVVTAELLADEAPSIRLVVPIRF